MNFEVEDLRIMIGQNLSLNFLIPLALEILEDNIFAEGDFYCGDLIESLLRVDKEFWKSNTDYKCDLESMLQKNIEDLKRKLDSFLNNFE